MMIYAGIEVFDVWNCVFSAYCEEFCERCCSGHIDDRVALQLMRWSCDFISSGYIFHLNQ